ncbi:MAG: hypothetical protein LC130_02515 [Bryobacterales bacterium]|nr:hypothetical protein [Bryobacterales bacterium]MEB2362091.1 hypothetical protein [Bryobacterales bacterium]
MNRWFIRFVCLAILLAFAVMTAQIAGLNGTWKLNVGRSRWGKVQKPVSVVLQIQHTEPLLTYSGTVIYSNEETRTFAFDGAIDGREYHMDRSYGGGNITIRRLNSQAIKSVFHSADGRFTETATTTISAGGKILTRQLQVDSPEGRKSWTEVYDKQ